MRGWPRRCEHFHSGWGRGLDVRRARRPHSWKASTDEPVTSGKANLRWQGDPRVAQYSLADVHACTASSKGGGCACFQIRRTGKVAASLLARTQRERGLGGRS